MQKISTLSIIQRFSIVTLLLFNSFNLNLNVYHNFQVDERTTNVILFANAYALSTKTNNAMISHNNISVRSSSGGSSSSNVKYNNKNDDDAVTVTVNGDTSGGSNKRKTKNNNNRINTRINPIPTNIPYSSAIQVLQTYKKLHGNLALPRRYIIPKEEEHLYPYEWSGIDISRTIYDMKWWSKHISKHSMRERVTQLNKLGFIWERLQPEWNLVLQALIVYKSLYPTYDESLLVPVSFVVPYNKTNWPQSTWGLHLGNQVYRIRARQDFIKHNNDHLNVNANTNDHAITVSDKADNRISQLNGLGFVWDVQEYHFQKVIDALLHYHKNNHDHERTNNNNNKIIKVPTTYVIPHNTTLYPKYLWGFQLGAKCCAIRNKDLYNIKNSSGRRQLLENIGFNFKGNHVLGWLDVVHALAIYSKLHNNDNSGSSSKGVCVPQNFIVPKRPAYACEWPWPEQLWGLPLGQRLRDIKSKGRYLKGESATSRKAQLYALGYNLFDDNDFNNNIDNSSDDKDDKKNRK